MPYEVSTPVFEGPFDLLLHLITSEQVDLYEVSISRIVDRFLAELSRMESLDLEVATEFLLIAATLVELKCRRLLPDPDDLDMDEELAAWEERDLLLARLLECKTYKDVADTLGRLMVDTARSIPRMAGPDETFAGVVPDILAGVAPNDLHGAMTRLLAPAPSPRVDLDHVAPIRMSVAEVVEHLATRLQHAGPITFRAMTSHLVERMEVIVNFLALLEMYKQGLVELDQGGTFGELHVLWTGGSGDPSFRAEISSDVAPGEFQASDTDHFGEASVTGTVRGIQ
ncbi:MAG: segregation and condensation protein A [Acidimicrobiales bacterium]